MPGKPLTEVCSQLNMSLDEIISQNGVQAGRAAAKAPTDKRSSSDRRGRGMFNVPRGIVKPRSTPQTASA